LAKILHPHEGLNHGSQTARWSVLSRAPTALSGLALVLFLVVHLAGISLAALAPQDFETWAARLHQQAWLPMSELALLTLALVHLVSTVSKRLINQSAGNTAALVSRRQGRWESLAAFAARHQSLAGLVLLVFCVVHLLQLRFPRAAAGSELETVQAVLHEPLNLVLYLTAACALGLHGFHGAEAAHRNLGLLNPSNRDTIRASGRMLSVLLGGGFTATVITLALHTPGQAMHQLSGGIL